MAEWYQINECVICMCISLGYSTYLLCFLSWCDNQTKLTNLAIEEFQQVLNITRYLWLEAKLQAEAYDKVFDDSSTYMYIQRD